MAGDRLQASRHERPCADNRAINESPSDRDRHSKINILKLFNRVPPKWNWVRSFLSELTFRID